MEVKVIIEAPELAKAIEKLADALEPTVLTEAIDLQASSAVMSTKEKANSSEEKESISEEVSESTHTIVDARKALASLVSKGKKDEAKKILSDLGCKQLSDVDPKDYGVIMNKCKEVA